MRITHTTDPNPNTPDNFDGEDLPETRKEKRLRYRDDDPRYWEEEDEHGEWDHLRPLLRWKLWFIVGSIVVVILLVSFVYIHWFRPYATGGVQYGYVADVQEKGSVFKTYEGYMLPYRNLMDTVRPYGKDFVFSAINDKVAADMHRAASARKPVRVEYIEYSASLPWRGDSKFIVTSVAEINPEYILPPNADSVR